MPKEIRAYFAERNFISFHYNDLSYYSSGDILSNVAISIVWCQLNMKLTGYLLELLYNKSMNRVGGSRIGNVKQLVRIWYMSWYWPITHSLLLIGSI